MVRIHKDRQYTTTTIATATNDEHQLHFVFHIVYTSCVHVFWQLCEVNESRETDRHRKRSEKIRKKAQQQLEIWSRISQHRNSLVNFIRFGSFSMQSKQKKSTKTSIDRTAFGRAPTFSPEWKTIICVEFVINALIAAVIFVRWFVHSVCVVLFFFSRLFVCCFFSLVLLLDVFQCVFSLSVVCICITIFNMAA